MTEFTNGNILESDTDAVVNTVNTVGVMGKGIALQFRKAYPAMFAEYERACLAGDVRTGRMHVYDLEVLTCPRYIINFPTKKHWKGKSKIEDIRSGLEDLILQVRARDIASVAVPPLGCGHGGLDWSDVRPLIVAAFEAVPEVRAVVYEPDGAPAPESQVNRTERPAMTLSRANVVRFLSRYCVLGYQLTLIETHKMLYFLQIAGEQLKLRFDKGKYGPYADNLRHVLHKFEGHFTMGFGDGQNSPDTVIRVLPGAVEEADAFVQGHPEEATETSARLGRVTDLIDGFESPYGMELLASVHWVANDPIESVNPTGLDSIVAAIAGWNDRKRLVMKPSHIKAAWSRLRENGWLPAT